MTETTPDSAPRDFDNELINCLRTVSAVCGIYRLDVEGRIYGHYSVRADTEKVPAKEIEELIAAEVDPHLMVTVHGVNEDIPAGEPIYLLATSDIKTPSLMDIMRMSHQHIINTRNALMVENGIVPTGIAGFVVDVSDPCCPAKLKELVGGDGFIKHCRASGSLPLASGAVPKELIIDMIDPVIRKMRKMEPRSLIVIPGREPDELPIVRALRNWRDPVKVPTVYVYQHKIGLTELLVPVILTTRTQ